MLLRLPPELIYSIAAFLPTASCLLRLAQTCRRLYTIVAADNYRIFQAFVQGQYPTAAVPPLWRDAAHALTLRSHAFRCRAVTARYVEPPSNAVRIGKPKTTRRDRPTLGYRPVIDSYESWYGDHWFARKEVLAWGAGADVVLRIKDLNSHDHHAGEAGDNRQDSYDGAKWVVFNDLPSVNSWDDVAGLHLLGGSSSVDSPDAEDLIVGRRNGELTRLSISPSQGSATHGASFDTQGHKLDYTDLSAGTERVLAVSLDRGEIAFYKLDSPDDIVQPFASLKELLHGASRNRCSKLLSDQRIVVGADGGSSKIDVYSFDPVDVGIACSIRIEDYESERKPRVTAMAPLPALSSMKETSSQDLFLSGWEDSKIRLHDLRSSRPCVAIYGDTVDDSPVYSLLPIGHERLMVGSGAHGLLKLFDLRVTGNHQIDSSNISPSVPRWNRRRRSYNSVVRGFQLNLPTSAPKGISIFLSDRQPENRHNTRFQRSLRPRYRGPVYTMSLPSPTSSTLYVGLVNTVMRLDMVGTEDLFAAGENDKAGQNWSSLNLSLPLNARASPGHQPADLSCYERPSPEDNGRGIRLFVQKPFWSSPAAAHQDDHIPGWDQRWFQPSLNRSTQPEDRWR
ncbi:F-box domain-containing protein [Nannizzia gypsea CBS 118893]|uniref:F-box domain-containing protein n=1 Tax=Arthroderma gypseum (strain ATCC MYA-4604 / CBS 118893) TaxID=535722 RepID=E4UQ35_ARTGP|nr:F-box domain-containing protein [Nannizzia gypsea CBS 118893]EFQ99954.1 F-box domain-containing protein [Nannizzia gypsea CBS 118893]